MAKLEVEHTELFVSGQHLFTVFTAEHALLDSQEIVPHIQGGSMVLHAFKHGAEQLDDFFKEGMVTVTLRVSDLGLVNVTEGLQNVVCICLSHLYLLHSKHRVDDDRLVHELVGADGLSIMSHLSQHSKGHLRTFSCLFVQTGREQHVDVTDTVDTLLAKVILNDFNIPHADRIDLNSALGRILLQVVRLNKELVVLCSHGVFLSKVGSDLDLSLEEKLFTLLLVFLDELGFAFGREDFRSNIVPLFVGAEDLLDLFMSSSGKLAWSVFGIVDFLVLRIMLHQVHSGKFKLVFDDAQNIALFRTTHFLESLNYEKEAFLSFFEIETLNEEFTKTSNSLEYLKDW